MIFFFAYCIYEKCLPEEYTQGMKLNMELRFTARHRQSLNKMVVVSFSQLGSRLVGQWVI